MILHDHFDINTKGHLTIGGLDTVDLAKEFGTPAYIMDENALRKMCRTYREAAIAAFGEAIRCGVGELKETGATLGALRDRLVTALTDDERFSSVSVTNPARHAPHILNITLPKIKSETMLHYLSSMGISVSSGSACSSHSKKTSRALLAFGLAAKEADCTVRISLCENNTKADIDALCDALEKGILSLVRIK